VLAGLAAVAALVYAVSSLLRLRDFQAGTYDLVIFDQALRSYSRFGAPVAMVKGVHNGFGPDFSVLGDHFSPILAVLAPLYWLHDGPETLLIAQAVLFALALVPIWRFTARRLGRISAYLVAGAFALSWPVAEAVAFDFHEVAFVPLLSALLVERYDAGRRGQAALAAFALLLVKEDMGLLVAGFGLYLLTRKGERRAGLAYVAAGTAAVIAASRVLISLFGGDNTYYWAYGSLGDDMTGVAVRVLTHPWVVLDAVSSPPLKLVTAALVVLPLLLLPLRSPLTLAAVPLLAERMLADRFGNWWEPRYHYNAFIIAVLVMASVDAIDRMRTAGRPSPIRIPRWIRLSRRIRLAWSARFPRGHAPAAAIFVAVVVTVPLFAFGDLFTPDLYLRGERERAAARAVAMVPDGALVETANNLGPALSSRAQVLLWDREPRSAPWVVADIGKRSFPFDSVQEQRARVAHLLATGYRTVYGSGGYVVLTRQSAPPPR
jgi:uncharacterized membrane protein